MGIGVHHAALPNGIEGQILKIINGQPVFVEPSAIYPSVSVYADLPLASAHTGALYYVTDSSGVWLINRKSRGFYRSSGAIWEYAGEMVEAFSSANFRLYDAGDDSKQLSVNLFNIAASTTRVITATNTDVLLTNNSVLHNNLCDPLAAAGHAVYLDSSGVAEIADATAFITANCVGVILSKSSISVCDILLKGTCVDLYTGLTPGTRYFLSASSPGGLTTTPPTGSGNVVLEVGQAINSTSLFINPRLIVIRS